MLIGRTKECRTLEGLLDAVRDGHSRALVLRGEAGTGKSALLRHLVEAASGFLVIHFTAVESEMELPFAGLHQLCSPLADHMASLPDPQRAAALAAFGQTTGEPPDRLLIGLAVLNLLSSAGEERPLLCVIDDAQWLDRASSQALSFVARRLLAEPVGVVFAERSASTDLADLPQLEVDPLREGDAQTLLSAVLRVPLDARVRDRIVAETHGNPLALVEWPRGLSTAELAGGFGLPAMLPMSTQIEELFRRRLADLPPTTRRFLTVAAAEPAGDSTTIWRAARRLDVGPDDALPAIEEGFVEVGVRVWFRHPLMRSASYGAATLAERQEVHRALAAETDPVADPDRRAWHRALGSPGPDEDIAQELERSADRARARGGLAAAGALLERSVALTIDPLRRAERALVAAEVTLDAGSFDVAGGLLAAADLAPLSELDRARLDLLHGRRTGVGGDVRDGARLLLRAAERLEALDLELAETTYLQAMANACTTGRFSRGVTLREISVAALARPVTAEPTTNQWLLTGLAQVSAESPAVALPALRRSLAGDATETFASGRSQLLGFQCGAASVLWDEDSLHRLAALKVDVTRDLGALSMLPSSLHTLAHVHALEGDLRTATALVAEAQEIVDAIGSTLLPWAAVVVLAFGGADEARQQIAEIAVAAAAAGHALAAANALWAGATFHNARGEYDQAFAIASDASRHQWEWGQQFYFHELVEAAVRTDHVAIALATVERLTETAEPSGSDWGLGLVARCRALLATGPDAEELHRRSIEHLSRTAIRPELARSRLLFGEWLRRANRRVDARVELRAAHELFTDMEMRAFAERARRELLVTGETVRGPRSSSFDELTPQEAHIARLAADGLTNPEIGERLFISPRTVEWHLRKVFTKLGLSSRRELASALAESSRRATS